MHGREEGLVGVHALEGNGGSKEGRRGRREEGSNEGQEGGGSNEGQEGGGEQRGAGMG